MPALRLTPHMHVSAGIYFFKVSIGNTKARCEICSNLTIKTPEQYHVFSLLTLNKWMSAGLLQSKIKSCSRRLIWVFFASFHLAIWTCWHEANQIAIIQFIDMKYWLLFSVKIAWSTVLLLQFIYHSPKVIFLNVWYKI